MWQDALREGTAMSRGRPGVVLKKQRGSGVGWGAPASVWTGPHAALTRGGEQDPLGRGHV